MLAPFPTPIMFVAWGTAPGKEWEGGSIGGGLIQKCLANKFPTVALQISQCTKQHVDWCREKGLKIAGWDHPGRFTKADYDARGFDGFIPQVESPDQLVGTINYLRDGVASGKPKAIITTYFGFDDGHGGEHWHELEVLGVSAAYVECYASDAASHADLDQMLGQGVIYGIPANALVPVCGTYRGELPVTYKGIEKQGREFGCYIAETMSDDQWKAWGGVNIMPQVYYWRLLAGASILHEERAVTYTPGDDGLTRMLTWMGQHKDQIRYAKSVDLVRVLV
jgi:hypothetical protein